MTHEAQRWASSEWEHGNPSGLQTGCRLGLGSTWSNGQLEPQNSYQLAPQISVRKIPWRRAQQPTPVFLPGDSYGQRSLGSHSPQVAKSWTHLKRLSTAQQQCPLRKHNKYLHFIARFVGNKIYLCMYLSINIYSSPLKPGVEAVQFYLLHW